MLRIKREQLAAALMTATLLGSTCGAAIAAVHVEGLAQAGGGPLANATVTLWAASSSDPRQLAQTKTGADGSFQLNSQENIGPDVILYLTAQGGGAVVSKTAGDNPAITWLSVLGNTSPAKAVINEMTTVASVWTNTQFLNGTALKGNPLGIKIAAGNVPSFVDLSTGGWGIPAAGGVRPAPARVGDRNRPVRAAPVQRASTRLRRPEIAWVALDGGRPT